MKPMFIPFARPNKNAKIERAIRTLKGELLTQQIFKDIDHYNKKNKSNTSRSTTTTENTEDWLAKRQPSTENK
ncbi:MAG: hypothetical protein Q7R47_05680 [Candidatus Diapherotrites archaeon]|nr:hypothetical protein [Candidatus Diapherotrites archaeon]